MMSSTNDRNLEFGKPDRISLGFPYLLIKYFTGIKIWLVSILLYGWRPLTRSTDTDKNEDDFDEIIGPLLEVYLTNHQGQ